MGKARKKHEAIDGLFAGIQPMYSMRDLLPEVARQSILVWEHAKGKKHNNNLYACSDTI